MYRITVQGTVIALQMLPDSRAASSIIVGESTRELKVKKESKTDWNTPAGNMQLMGKQRSIVNC
jgi:hypothetical protein